MKKFLYVGLVAAGIGLSLSSISMTAEAAYQCAWRHGQKVCWHEGQRHCRWVNGHWRNGHYIKGHKECWYRR